MDVIRFAISKPVTVTVGVILVIMFGLIGLRAMPIQLSPNVDRPEITVSTGWPGRSPQEIVEEITKEQEEQLKNVANLKSMKSVSREGASEIVLEFYIGTNINRALQEVSDSLRQVSQYPEDVDEPAIKAADGAAENAIAWIIIDLDPAKAANHPDFDITTLYQAIEREIKPYLERVDGVAEVNIYGGREREMRILVDPVRLANRGLTYGNVLDAIRAENRDISAGSISEGKRDYRVRVLGQFVDDRDILNTIVAYRDGLPVYVRDVAEVELGHVKKRGFVRSLGYPAIAINCIRQSGANVMAVMEGVRERLDEVRAEILPRLHPTAGPDLRLRQAYDETIYITSSINLVTQNLWLGGGIAALVLMIFLRSFTSTGVVALAIPISVVGTFLMLLALGRTLNVISLAGIAFAVGMVVDNAIVVLENIHRHREMGKPPLKAAYEGGREVWGAILASTLTTVAVFIPVLTIQEEAGQLFRDISLAIVSAVVISLVVSITVIPAACSRWLTVKHNDRKSRLDAIQSLFGLAPLAARLVRSAGTAIHWLITGWRGWSIRPAMIVLLTVLSLWGAAKLMPPLDYLPPGNRNLVFGGLLIPPGQSVEQMELIANRIEDQLRPYVEAKLDKPETLAALSPIQRGPGLPPFDPVPIDNFFIGAFNGGMFVGATSADPQVVLPIGTLATNAMSGIPDAYGGARQSSLFGRGVGGGNSIDLEISGPDLDRVKLAAERLFSQIGQAPEYGYRNLRANPSNFSIDQQELQARLTRLGTELGLRTEDVGIAMRALFDGAFAGDYRDGADTIDIRLLPIGGRLLYKEQTSNIPIATPLGRTVPLSSVIEMTPALAPQEIRRIEELPSITLSITPPPDLPLEAVMDDLQANYIAPARAAGLIDRTMRIRLEGSAARLDQVKASLLGDPAQADAPAIVAFAGRFGALAVLLGFGCLATYGIYRGVRRRAPMNFYGAAGAIVLGIVLASCLFTLHAAPQLMTARFVWALVVTYLLMCALFESFTLPFVIMFSVPLAIVGGFAGLRIVHDVSMRNPILAPQNLDVLTMLGFVILIGVVVNNAILIVHQALNLMRGEADASNPTLRNQQLSPPQAIAESVRTRIRPVFMGTMTSVGGMLPLVLFPGAGSELYRGLGSVVIGGLLLSTVFTLILVPLLLSLTLQMGEGLRGLLRAAPTESDRHGTRDDRPQSPRSPDRTTLPTEKELEPA